MTAARIATAAAAIVTAAAAGASTGCLDPLVKDTPAASANLLPGNATVPFASTNPDLKAQITGNDGIDDKTLAMNGNIIPLATGQSGGAPVRYWSFGPMTRAPSPLYKFYAADGVTPLDNPKQYPLVDALPGDPAYSGVHSLVNVTVTDKYDGRLITTSAALDDAVELGLIAPPMPMAKFVASPIVLMTTGDTAGPLLQVGDAPPGGQPAVAMPVPVYGRGYVAGIYELGGALGVQPGPVILPVSQVSYLRPRGAAVYDPTNPVFQAVIPTAPAGMTANYTPLSVVVDVDLIDTTPAAIHGDADLFDRTAGTITGVKPAVAQFQITTSIVLLPLQFTEGQP